jgi:adenylyl cyclase-associated protein
MSDTALLQTIADRLAAIESHLGISGGGGGGSSGGAAELPRSIRAYDQYSTDNLDPFVAVCDKLGGDCAKLGALVKDAWNEQRSFLIMASACKEPPATAMGPLLSPIGEKTRAIGNLLQRNEWEKHVKTCQEGVQCLNWLVVKPAPRDFIGK